jgi:phage/plasmid-like protein (TIGR03299 family)
MKLPKTILVGGNDLVEMYLLAWNSHDGTSGFNVVVTPQRVVCQNTLTVGIGRAKASWSIRHTGDVARQVTQARDAMGMTFAYADAFEKEANALYEQAMTQAEFDKVVAHLLKPVKDATDRQVENVMQQRKEVSALFTAPTQANVAGTKWAAFNAVTEWADWVKGAKGSDGADAARATRTVASIASAGGDTNPLAIKRIAWNALVGAK